MHCFVASFQQHKTTDFTRTLKRMSCYIALRQTPLLRSSFDEWISHISIHFFFCAICRRCSRCVFDDFVSSLCRFSHERIINICSRNRNRLTNSLIVSKLWSYQLWTFLRDVCVCVWFFCSWKKLFHQEKKNHYKMFEILCDSLE